MKLELIDKMNTNVVTKFNVVFCVKKYGSM
jgi:hypothetical protein